MEKDFVCKCGKVSYGEIITKNPLRRKCAVCGYIPQPTNGIARVTNGKYVETELKPPED